MRTWKEPAPMWDEAAYAWEEPTHEWEDAAQVREEAAQAWDEPAHEWKEAAQAWDEPAHEWKEAAQARVESALDLTLINPHLEERSRRCVFLSKPIAMHPAIRVISARFSHNFFPDN